jgi:hypothetical protein
MSITDWVGKSSYLLAIGGTGVLIAAVIVSYVVYDPNNLKEVSDSDSDSDTEGKGINITPIEEDDYDKKYMEELKELEPRILSDEDLEGLKDNLLEEDTPLGLIKMFYDHEYKGFMWYCDRNHVPYRFLETVTRKYIIEFDCFQLYVDLYNELEKSKRLTERAEEKLSTTSNSLFVKSKDSQSQLLKLLSIKNNHLKFKYRGKLEEYKPPTEPSTFNIINIDFSTYKQLKEKSN